MCVRSGFVTITFTFFFVEKICAFYFSPQKFGEKKNSELT